MKENPSSLPAAKSSSGAPHEQFIPRRLEPDPAPPSFAQERLWFLDQMGSGNFANNYPVALRFTGLLNLRVLERSLGEVLKRHEALRTVFPATEERPVQLVVPAWQPDLPVVDLTGLPVSEQEAQTARLAKEDAQRPFDLTQGPLLRANLLRLDAKEHVLLLTVHHIAFDCRSVGILMQELAALYEAFSNDQPSPLPDLPIQYTDFAVWQREWMRGEALDEQIGYWKRQLDDVPALQLPTDRPRPPVQTHRGARQSIALPESLTKALKDLSRREGATLFMVLLAAFQALLSRYSGQEDVAVGSPIAGRNRAETEGLIGFFVNTLVLRADLSGDPTFQELLGRVREAALGAYTHQDVPFEKLVEELQPERDMSRTPLFQVFFSMINVPSGQTELPGLRMERFSSPHTESKFDLTLYAREWSGKIQLELVYNADLFERARMTEMLAQLNRLLEQIVANPQEAISSHSLVTMRSRSLLPDPKAALAEPHCEPITKTFLSCVKRTPRRSAIRQGEEAWSYADLARSARGIARHLLARGLERGDVVALVGPRSFGLITGMVAVLLGRGVLLTIDHNLPVERQRLMLREAGAKHLLYIGSQRPEEEWTRELPSVVVTFVDSNAGRVTKPQGISNPEETDLPEPNPDDPAYIFFTSGTTGTPKGILGCHKGLSHFLDWQRETFGVGPQDRCAQLTSLSFDVLLRDVFLPLTSGATLFLPEEGNDLSAGHILPWLERERISLLHTVPALAQSWLGDPPAGVSLRALRGVFFAGEPLTEALVCRWREVFPKVGEMVNLYGATEATMAQCFYRVPPQLPPGIQPVGWPLPQTQALVLSGSGQMCGIGEPGEIVIRTPFRTLGYIGAAHENSERFVRNPFRDEEDDLLYYTGDRGRYRTDGALEFLGRLDHQVKIRGVRIEPGEVETILGQHPAVRQSVVVARENDVPDGVPFGSKRLVAYVVSVRELEPSVSELRGHLKAKLPEYMVPSAFVMLEALPLTPNGKVDRRALPAPDRLRPELENVYVAPRTALEQFLANGWQDILDVKRVGVHDNFFELGGDSIRGAVFINRLQQALGELVYVVAIFDAPTIAELASYLHRHYPDTVARLCAIKPPNGVEGCTQVGSDPAASGQTQRVDAPRVAHFRRQIKPLPPRQEHDAAVVPKNPPAIFILSPPRSGSTLLRVMLGGHPLLFAPPELDLLSFNTLVERKAALAGRYSFRLEGTIRAIMELKGCDAEKAKRIMDDWESRGLTTAQCYRLMQTWMGDRTLVDKTASYSLDLETLKRAEADFEQALYIHLPRHPRAMIRSFEEAKLDQVFFRYEHTFSVRESAELIWSISHQNILEFLKGVSAHRQYRLKYEELVDRPRSAVEGLCRFLGLAFHPDMLQPHGDRETRMTDGIHPLSKMLGDPKFHQHQGIDAEAADRWRADNTEDFLGDITWQLAELLGYERPARNMNPVSSIVTLNPDDLDEGRI